MGRPRKELRLRCREGIWYATVYGPDDIPYERSTGERDEAEAASVALSWKQDAEDPDRGAKEATLNDALTSLLSDRAAKVRAGERSSSLVAYYTKHAGLLVGFFSHDHPLSSWMRDSSESWRYIEWRRQSPVQDRTIAKELKTLRAALYVAREQGVFRGDPELAVPPTFTTGAGRSDRNPTRAEILSIIPHMAPDAAAITAFILATSAETSAVRRAAKTDIPKSLTPPFVVHIRGTKTEGRDRKVPIVTEEQVVLFKFALTHARGDDGLFSSLDNFGRALGNACVLAAVEHISPHALRHAAGQWLIDQGVPIELVSRVLGHTNTAITERVYARVKTENLTDRMLDAIDPAYAKTASKRRKKQDRKVETIKKLPTPKGNVLYKVGKEEKTLTGWAQSSGISKTTLHYRMAQGLSMEKAISLGRGTRGKAIGSFPAFGTAAKLPRNGGQKRSERTQNRTPENADPSVILVPRDGIEPPTRGFSKQLEKASSAEEKATEPDPLLGSCKASDPATEPPRIDARGQGSDPDVALKDAIKAAVDAGLYERAARLLDVLRATPNIAPVVDLVKRR